MLVQRLSDLPNLFASKANVIDTETSGFYVYHGDRIAGFAIGPYDDLNANYYIPVRHRCEAGQVNLPLENVCAWLRDLFKNSDVKWIGHNLKYDINMMRADDLEMIGPVRDTMILAHIFGGDEFSYDMTAVTKRWLSGFEHVHYKALEEWFEVNQPKSATWEGKMPRNYSTAPLQMVCDYACEDLVAPRLLVRKFSELELWGPIPNAGYPALGAKELIVSDMECIKALADMEYNGALIDKDKTLFLRDQANDEIDQMSDELYKLSGKSFSVSSWKDTWDAFERVGGVVKYWGIKKELKKGKQKDQQFTMNRDDSTNRPSWNAAAILLYIDDFQKTGNTKALEFVTKYREIDQRSRLVSTNLDVYLKKMDANNRIHGQFHMHRVVTGRLSSTEPNEQNVAKPGGNADLKALEKLLGAKNENALSRQLRSLFIAEPGCWYVSTDQSQVEYRIAAFLANDPVLLEKYRNDPKTDYHQATCDIVGIDRDLAKTVNFLSLYGGGPTALASKLTASGRPTTIFEAKVILNNLFAARPALRGLLENMSMFARKHGYVQNQLGRRCPIPPGLDYIATNYADQGAAGDNMRVAIVRIHAAIKKNKWPVKMSLTVHDELTYQIPKEYTSELAPKLAELLCYAPWFGVPLLSDIEYGNNWGDLKALESAA